jgi:tRNA dimethylallyltransferase
MSSSAASDDAEPAVRTIPVICGPTGAGKSAIAAWLSQRRELLVISADSRQVYRGFDIGTAKPPAPERAKVPHRGIDVVDPTERYSAAQWAALASAAIDEADAQRRLPLIVGGTGFYIGALFRPLWEEPELDPSDRQAVQATLDAMSLDELRRWCSSLDPRRAHLGRAQLLRAIEVALLTGERLSQMHVARARPALFQPSYLLVDPGMELQSRIVARASAMFDAGWPDEVRRLLEVVPPDGPAWKATGYEVMQSYVRGELDRASTLERVIIDTRQYAKRQRTWFRHQLGREQVQRVAPDAPGWQEVVNRWITSVDESVREEGSA